MDVDLVWYEFYRSFSKIAVVRQDAGGGGWSMI